MKRCGNFRKNSAWDIGQCRICWLSFHSAEHAAWKNAGPQCPSLSEPTASPFRQDRTSRCHWTGATVREITVGPHGQKLRRVKQRVEKMCCGKPPEKKKVFSCEHPRRLGEEVTAKDCHSCPLHSEPKEDVDKLERLLLTSGQSPGDILVMTAAVEMLGEQYGKRFLVSVRTTAQGIWDNNPHVAPLQGSEFRTIQMNYPLIHQSNSRPVHFLQGYVDWLASELGIKLDLTIDTPRLYFSQEELAWKPRIEPPYWLICSGVKDDYTVKAWGHERYQAVIDALPDIRFVQVGEAGHMHKPLRGVIDQIGKTNTRELLRLAYFAQGGVGGVSFLHHIFAALRKPFVCIASGMEPVRWEAYPTETVISSHGQLPCCQYKACWKSRVVPLPSGKNDALCLAPVNEAEPVAACMARIAPERVIEAIRAYRDML